MSFRHDLLASTYPLWRLGHKLTKVLESHPIPRLRVLLYHDIPPNQVEKFRHQLLWLKKKWEFITPEKFESIIQGDSFLERDSLLLTFDDGYFSNRIVADSILQPLGIKAIFFVVSKFVQINSLRESRSFIGNHIIPGIPLQLIPEHMRNMNLTDLEYLLQLGHSIGGHTATHPKLSNIPIEELHDEVIKSANNLENKLGIKIRHFANTFGDIASLSRDALLEAKSRFDFIHTSIRGNNWPTKNSSIIWRETLSPADSLFLLGSFLEGAADPIYKRARDECRIMEK